MKIEKYEEKITTLVYSWKDNKRRKCYVNSGVIIQFNLQLRLSTSTLFKD